MTVALHPELVAFERGLDESGIVVAVHSDHLCVRLPLLASVRLRFDGTRLTFDPRFGTVSRTMATASTIGSVSALIVAMTVSGVALPAIVAAGAIGALASAYDVMRYVVTESAITRVTYLWAARRAAAAPLALGVGPAAPMRADAGAETVRAPRHAE